MTQEQLDIIRDLIEDYDMFTDIFSDMGWAKTRTKYIKTPRLVLNASASFISFRFVKGFVCEHFTEAVTQVMVQRYAYAKVGTLIRSGAKITWTLLKDGICSPHIGEYPCGSIWNTRNWN